MMHGQKKHQSSICE